MGKSPARWVSASASMRSMAIERRALLRTMGGLAGLAAGVMPIVTGAAWGSEWAPAAADAAAAHIRYLAARKQGASYEAVVFDAHGGLRHVVPLPDRGHSFALDDRRRRAVVFGRQPGFFALGFKLDGGSAPEPLPLPEGRHFFGHGVFIHDGALLLATENDYEAGRGVVGVYDASQVGAYRRIGEFASGGVGPHEIVALPGSHLVVVANGGILTHPDYGKMALNLATMRPSLTYIDARSGDIVEHIELPAELRQLSIRHLVVDAGNRVWFGCQYSGPARDMPPLVGSHQRGSTVRVHTGNPEVLRAMRNYVGSLAVDASGTVIATSSPVGGVVAYWRADSGRLLGTTELADGCGVAPAGMGRFLLSSGRGVLDLAGPQTLSARLSAHADVSWDNHLRRMVAPA